MVITFFDSRWQGAITDEKMCRPRQGRWNQKKIFYQIKKILPSSPRDRAASPPDPRQWWWFYPSGWAVLPRTPRPRRRAQKCTPCPSPSLAQLKRVSTRVFNRFMSRTKKKTKNKRIIEDYKQDPEQNKNSRSSFSFSLFSWNFSSSESVGFTSTFWSRDVTVPGSSPRIQRIRPRP